jgi:hypothetical protein
MTKPAGRRLILMAMPAVSAASYVGAIRLTEPRPLPKAPRNQEPGPHGARCAVTSHAVRLTPAAAASTEFASNITHCPPPALPGRVLHVSVACNRRDEFTIGGGRLLSLCGQWRNPPIRRIDDPRRPRSCFRDAGGVLGDVFGVPGVCSAPTSRRTSLTGVKSAFPKWASADWHPGKDGRSLFRCRNQGNAIPTEYRRIPFRPGCSAGAGLGLPHR